MHEENIYYSGNTKNPSQALILLHGRGADANDILALAENFHVGDFLLAAPEATGNTWYPFSFLAPPDQNEPWLSSALDLIHKTVSAIEKRNINKQHIYFMGFSQGACLTLEFIARNGAKYGGAAAFTGGLIGDKLYAANYKHALNGTPVFLGTSDPDMHVPVSRVKESALILENLGAQVTLKVYDNIGHTINQDEIAVADSLLFTSNSKK